LVTATVRRFAALVAAGELALCGASDEDAADRPADEPAEPPPDPTETDPRQ